MPALLERIRQAFPASKKTARAVQADRKSKLRSEIQDRFKEKFKHLEAKYDAAQNTTDNERHWANADSASADASASPAVRQRLRNRSRYECQDNNCYGKGIILKHANHIVGRVPRLQMQTSDEGLNDFIELHFEKWSKAICLGQKLRTMAKSKTVDGEAFAQLVNNEKVAHIVKLDLSLIEADQIATPLLLSTPNYIDGIKFDASGLNPVHYDVLDQHPGDIYAAHNAFSYKPKPVPAEEMLHWTRQDRPKQYRPPPETTPALPLFSQLRRFTMATIAAAETAAEMAGVIKTTASDVDTDEIEALDAIDIEMRQLLTLPMGWDISQLKAEHPTTTYDMFETKILTQIAQPVLMPYNIAAGDSSKHNFASGRLDHKMYEASIGVERYDLECTVLLKLFAAWYREFRLAAVVLKLYSTELPSFDEIVFAWFFDAADHAVDPSKDASGEEKRLGFGGVSLAELYGRRGLDYRREMRKAAEAFGVPIEEYQSLVRQKVFGAVVSEDPEEEEDDATVKEDDSEVDDEPKSKATPKKAAARKPQPAKA